MPTPTTMTIPAAEVKIGDTIAGVPVETIDTKVKWTVIKLANGKSIRVENDDIRVVTRAVPTDEELAAVKAARAAEALQYGLEQAFRSCVAAYTRVNATAAEIVNHVGSRIDWQHSSIESYLNAVAERDLWANVVSHVGRTYGTDADHPKAVQLITFMDAILEEVKEVERKLLRNDWRGRSTSEAFNLCEHTMADVAAKWLDSGYGGVSMVRHYATQQ